MRLSSVALLLIAVTALQAQVYDPRLSSTAQVDLLQIQTRQLEDRLQQQQALQSSQALQGVQQLQMQRQMAPMMAPMIAPAIMPGSGLSGKWWNRAALAARIGLTAEQQKKMEDIYQQARLHMIDLNAALQKEQARLEPMISADQPDHAAIDAQIDRAGKARVEVEKANTSMTLAIRAVLTPEQWTMLKGERD